MDRQREELVATQEAQRRKSDLTLVYISIALGVLALACLGAAGWMLAG